MPAVGVASGAEPQPQKIIYNSTYDLFQSHFSLDGLWIVFEAFRESPKIESTLYVIPSMCGAWIPVTSGRNWDDKPRWSPMGRRSTSRARGYDGPVMRATRVTARGNSLLLFEAHNYLCAGMPLFDISDGVSRAAQLITLIDHRSYSSGFHEFAKCCQIILFQIRDKERELLA